MRNKMSILIRGCSSIMRSVKGGGGGGGVSQMLTFAQKGGGGDTKWSLDHDPALVGRGISLNDHLTTLMIVPWNNKKVLGYIVFYFGQQSAHSYDTYDNQYNRI